MSKLPGVDGPTGALPKRRAKREHARRHINGGGKQCGETAGPGGRAQGPANQLDTSESFPGVADREVDVVELHDRDDGVVGLDEFDRDLVALAGERDLDARRYLADEDAVCPGRGPEEELTALGTGLDAVDPQAEFLR